MTDLTRILFLGDVVGKPGRIAVAKLLPLLKEKHQPHLVIINGENASQGYGIGKAQFTELIVAGADVITSGNHIWDRAETEVFIRTEPRLLRPANFPTAAPGHGYGIFPAANGTQVAVLNLAGRVEMPPADCPFRAGASIANIVQSTTPIIIVDLHAEASSEKQAMALYLDGKVSAVLGTHTHLPTADAHISKKGTASQCDLGICGVAEGSVLGFDHQAALDRFLIGISPRLTPAKGKPEVMGILLNIDSVTGKTLSFLNIREKLDQEIID
jgi:2',3'-cyclic-nucleotide 2'-phosphodiesterase